MNLSVKVFVFFMCFCVCACLCLNVSSFDLLKCNTSHILMFVQCNLGCTFNKNIGNIYWITKFELKIKVKKSLKIGVSWKKKDGSIPDEICNSNQNSNFMKYYK